MKTNVYYRMLVLVSKNDDASRLGWWLDQKRGVLDLTWDEVAERAGVSVQTLYRASPNMRTPKRKAIERALQWTNGSIDDILNGGEPTDTEPQDQTDTSFEERLAELEAAVRESREQNLAAAEREAQILDELNAMLKKRRAG